MLSLVFGVPLAWVFARVRLPGLRLIRAVVLLPLVLPPVVGGVALLLALGRNGVVGQHLLTWFGVDDAVHVEAASSSPRPSSRCRS